MTENITKISHSDVMNGLKKKLWALNEYFGESDTVVYIDYPLHNNIGDLLIYHGTEKYFKDRGISVVKRMSIHNFNIDVICKDYPNAIVVCHGGGNFGDLYLASQALRRKLVKRFKGKIIILPQTIYYADKANLERDAELFLFKNNISLFVRDKPSKKVADLICKNAELLPDMAHWLWPNIPDKKETEGGRLYFLRKDIEAPNDSDYQDITNSLDWGDLSSLVDKIVIRLLRFASELKLGFLDNIIAKMWYFYSGLLIKKAVNIFQSADVIITSRLHGHILSALLSKKSVLIDNSYGKNINYANEWTIRSELVDICET